MKLTNELIEKAKTAKTAEELLAMAKAENIEMTAEEAAKVYAELHKTGALSDEELDNVSGGCDKIEYDDFQMCICPSNIDFAFEIGTRVVVRDGFFHDDGTIIDRMAFRYDDHFQGEYLIHFDDPSKNDKWVNQSDVGIIVG